MLKVLINITDNNEMKKNLISISMQSQFFLLNVQEKILIHLKLPFFGSINTQEYFHYESITQKISK